MGEFLRDIDALNLADENLRFLRNVHARQLGNRVSALSDDFRVQRAVDEDGMAHLVQLVALEEIASAALKLIAHLVIDAVQHGHALLGCANHAVVKRLGMDDGADCQLDIGGFVDDDRRVARADA